MAKLLLGSVVGPQGPQGTPGVNGSQGPQGIPGPNEIAATTDVVGLTSGQLLYNNGGKVGSVEIVDNLLSIDPDKPLSANQGKVLKGLIDDNGSAIGQLNDKSLLIQDYITVGNITGVTKNGYFLTGPDITGLPITGEWGKCIQTIYQDNSRMIYFYTVVSKRFFVGHFLSAVGTFEWKEIATNEKYIMQASDMRNGWILGYGNIIQKIGNRVFARFILNSGVTTAGTVVCNFPVGFRPIEVVFVTIYTYATVTENPVNQFMSILPDGNAKILDTNSKPFISIEASWEV